MTREYLLHIIENGESETIEFKTSFNRATIETIVAFSNTKGGIIALGINNKKDIVGISITGETIQKWINEIKQNAEPAIFPAFEIVDIDKKTVIIISVDEFPLKPVSYKGRYFCRKINSNHQLSIDEIIELRYVSLSYSFDAFEVSTIFQDLDINALSYFKRRLSESGRYKSSDNLVNDFEKLGFIKHKKLTRAAELLFGTHHTSLHLGRFKSPSTIIDDIVIRSPLILAVDEALDFIKRNISLGYEFGDDLKRRDKWQYPIPALRELLLNAIVHRDYSNPTDVIIKIFDERIEISNPGSFPIGITIKDILTDNYQSKHRNKLLAEAFYLTGDIEKYGTGFIRLREWLKEYPNLELKVIDLKGFIRTELIIMKNEPVNERQKLIIKLIKQKTNITINELANECNTGRETIKRDLSKLKILNIIQRVGSDKTGYWKVIDKMQ